jgi:ATP diphosphatase
VARRLDDRAEMPLTTLDGATDDRHRLVAIYGNGEMDDESIRTATRRTIASDSLAKGASFAASRDIAMLIALMSALRDKKTGCPWDIEQSFASIAPYTIEEAYEVAQAIADGDMSELREELGDLLLQVVFHAQMGSEAGAFDFGDVVEAITDKLIRRHPHVFGNEHGARIAEVNANWERIKREEKERKRAREPAVNAKPPSLLDGIVHSLPALTRAEKLQARAARIGFDWTTAEPILAKLREEIAECEAAMATQDQAAIAEEVGDLLFTVANLARRLGVDAEAAGRAANRKFERRFRVMEGRAAEAGQDMAKMSLDELELLWTKAKRELADEQTRAHRRE